MSKKKLFIIILSIIFIKFLFSETKEEKDFRNYIETSIEFKNQEAQMATKELFVKVVDAIKLYLNIDEGQVKTITWYNKKGKPHIINNDGDICIYCYNVALDKEFQSLKGEFTASNPYDPTYWGWT